MPDLAMMTEGARVLVTTLTNVQPDEQVLIIIDRSTSYRIADAAVAAVHERQGIPIVVSINETPYPNAEPPSAVAAAMLEAKVLLCFVKQSLFHTQARLTASARGARMLSCTGIVEETLVRGPIKADFFRIKPVVDALSDAITHGQQIHITSPAGTDLVASVEGRRANREIWSREPGQASGAPSIEVNVAPLEGTAEGVIVVDASVASIGLLEEPIRLIVEKGVVKKFLGGPQAAQLQKMVSSVQDPRAYVVAEIGIGLNPEGRVTGNIFEDESAFGTAHFALGKNVAHGGQNPAPIHIDMVFLKPYIEVDGRAIVGDGILTL